jgi:hypothetical protein
MIGLDYTMLTSKYLPAQHEAVLCQMASYLAHLGAAALLTGNSPLLLVPYSENKGSS